MRTDGWPAIVPDAVLAAGFAGLLLADALLGATTPRPVDFLLLLAGSMVLAARRRVPRTVLLVAVGCALAYTARVEPGPVATVPVLVALYTVVRAGYRMLAAVTAVLLATGTVVSGLTGGDGVPVATEVQDALVPVGWLVAAWVLGEVTRHRHAYLEQVERRAEDAERTGEEVARRRAVQERLRIARELHDSLTHSISVITVQASVALHLAAKRGEHAPDALVAIQDASRDAVRELRSTLDVLRHDEDDAPGSGLDQLAELVARTRSAGLPATVRVTGRPRALPREVDRAAYRIVQEALTNASRHAGAASAAISLDYGGDELTVRIDDDGTATPATDTVPGVGLIGMRERVAGLGGSLHAAPRPDGGFTVRAGIPVQEAP